MVLGDEGRPVGSSFEADVLVHGGFAGFQWYLSPQASAHGSAVPCAMPRPGDSWHLRPGTEAKIRM